MLSRHTAWPNEELIANIGHWSFDVQAINLTQYHMLLADLFRRCYADGLDALLAAFSHATLPPRLCPMQMLVLQPLLAPTAAGCALP